jgi:hypothetical protein
MARHHLLLFACLAILGACNPEIRGRTCEGVDDCTYQETCVEGRCVPLDAVDGPDARLDGDGQEPSDVLGDSDQNPDSADAAYDESSCDLSSQDCSEGQ